MAALHTLTYPDAPRGDDVDLRFGVSVTDPYRGLEELDAFETRVDRGAKRAHVAIP